MCKLNVIAAHCLQDFDANFKSSRGKMNSTTILHINCKFLAVTALEHQL
jgi:hypothetical protein